MRRRLAWVVLLVGSILFAGCLQGASDAHDVERPVAVFETSHGVFRVALYGDLVPETVRNFGELASSGFYDGTRFHRVVAGFLNQGGDPYTAQDNESRWGNGNPGYHIIDEFPCNDGTLSHEHEGLCDEHAGLALPHDEPGVLSMANMGEPRTAGSQFFVTADRASWLNGGYAAFGRVVEGLDVVQAINAVETGTADRPVEDVILDSVRIEGSLPHVEVQRFDVPGAGQPGS